MLELLRSRRINNRRSRAIVREYLAGRPDPDFDAVKYRSKLRSAVVHAHLKLGDERGPFLFHGWRKRVYTRPLLETFRQAHYTQEALFELPFTIAEGLAYKHGIPRAVFLERIAPRLTQAERLRLQGAAARADGVELSVELSRVPLTRLALYALSLPAQARQERREELHAALGQSSARTLARAPVQLGRVAAVLDNSYSSSGSHEKRRRPSRWLWPRTTCWALPPREYRAFWTTPSADPLLDKPRGQTDLATPLLDALEWKPELVVVVSDGYDNGPPNAVADLTRIFRTKLDPAAPHVHHPRQPRVRLGAVRSPRAGGARAHGGRAGRGGSAHGAGLRAVRRGRRPAVRAGALPGGPRAGAARARCAQAGRAFAAEPEASPLEPSEVEEPSEAEEEV